MKYIIPIISIILAAVVTLSPSSTSSKPGSVTAACQAYQEYFLDAVELTRDKLRGGDLSTAQESRDFRAGLNREAMKKAFTPLAEKEAAAFAGGWSPEKEIEVLEGYLDGQ